MTQRMLFGALAGLSATMAMTAAMRRLFPRLNRGDRYPLPPREITETLLPPDQRGVATATVLAHFGYGAAAGAVFGLLPPRNGSGVLYGAAVWSASYLGWIPAMHILKPATSHPSGRNLLMITAHLVWGTALDIGLRELDRSAQDIFAPGALKDRQRNGSRSSDQ